MSAPLGLIFLCKCRLSITQNSHKRRSKYKFKRKFVQYYKLRRLYARVIVRLYTAINYLTFSGGRAIMLVLLYFNYL